MKCLLLSSILLLASLDHLSSQIRYRVSAGLSTNWIISDNPAVDRIVANASGPESRPEDPTQLGGAFDGNQIGYGIRAYVDLDKQKLYRIPFGVDVFMLRGSQSFTGTNFGLLARHSTDVYSFHAGFEYSFVEFPLAFARAYVAGELRGSMVTNGNLYTRSRVLGSDSRITTVESNFAGKSSAFRLGSMIRLGLEGEIYYPVFLNTSVGYGAMNLVGRDTRLTTEGGRGELLTPSSQHEGPEQIIQNMNFTFMVQVRL
jgi:hypothetical protein